MLAGNLSARAGDGQEYYWLPRPGAMRDKYRITGPCPNPAPGFVFIQPVDGRSGMCAQMKDMRPVAAPPAPGTAGSVAWFVGTWGLTVVSGTVDRVQGNWVVRHEETGAKGGSVQIKADHSFVWDQGQPARRGNVIKGTWRSATAKEMQGYEGEGLVLEHGEGGWDWLAVRYLNSSDPAGRSIRFLDNGTRNLQRIGSRQ